MRCQYKFFWIFLLCFVSPALFGQRYIHGRVSDADDSVGISDAAVFITNSTIGTTTDSAGYYRLKLPEDSNYRLGISHVAYQPVFANTDADTIINVAMQINEMEEVAVSVKVQFRKKDIDIFWNTILGKKPSPKAIHVLNPEAVYYYYNPKLNILRVSCRVPLQIINYETGFKMQYVLKYFLHNYNTDLSSWEGQCYFTELKPETVKQKKLWDDNRKKIYQVSITKFAKSLHDNTLWENGFLLAMMKEDDNPLTKSPHTQTAGRYQGEVFNYRYENFDNTYYVNYFNNRQNTRFKFNITGPQLFLYNDSALTYKKFRVPSDIFLMLICFGKPITNDELKMTQGEKSRDGWQRIGLYRSNIITPGDTVHIFQNGSVANTLRVRPVFSSDRLSGLNMILPVDYNPDEVTPVDDGTIAY